MHSGTVDIVTKEPYAPALYILSLYLAIVPPDAVKQKGDTKFGLAETVAYQLQQVGIRSKIDQLERATGFARYKNRDFKVYFFTWPENPEPDRHLYSLFHSKARGYYYKNAEADRLLDLGRSTFDVNERRKVYQQFHKFIVDDAPWVFLYTQKTGFGVRQRVKWEAPWDSFIRVVDADVAR